MQIAENVKISESGIASQIPSIPKILGRKINAGIKNTQPRSRAKNVAGFIRSRL